MGDLPRIPHLPRVKFNSPNYGRGHERSAAAVQDASTRRCFREVVADGLTRRLTGEAFQQKSTRQNPLIEMNMLNIEIGPIVGSNVEDAKFMHAAIREVENIFIPQRNRGACGLNHRGLPLSHSYVGTSFICDSLANITRII